MKCDWVERIELYESLRKDIYRISELSNDERQLYRKVTELFYEGPTSCDFSNIWRFEIDRVRGDRSRKEMTGTSIYKICADLESRLAIDQGIASPPDE